MSEQKLKVHGAVVTFTGRPDVENRSMRRAAVKIALLDEENSHLSDPELRFEFRLPISDETKIADAEATALRAAAVHLQEIAKQIISMPAADVLRPLDE